MKNSKKRGFTIVELVIVIAVIAILAGVLIPTFVSVINKANESTDTALIKYLNTSLKSGSVGQEQPKTMQQALDIVEADGYNVAKIKATASGASILWDSVNNCFAYLKKDATEPTYIPDSGEKTAKNVDLWVIAEEGKPLNETYSNYIPYTVAAETLTAKTGLDVGKNTGVSINYTRETGEKQSVVFNMNGGTLTVNAPADDVHRYGVADKVVITAVAPTSYYECGEVKGDIVITKGRVELTANAEVTTVLVASAAAGDVKVDVVEGAQVAVVAPTTDSAKEDVKNSTTVPADVKVEEKVEINPDFAGGLGTERSPYLIANGEQFANMNKLAEEMQSGKEYYFKQIADITVTKRYTGKGFAGSYDGSNYNITADLTASARNYTSLFGVYQISGHVSFKNMVIEMDKVGVSLIACADWGTAYGADFDNITFNSKDAFISVECTNFGFIMFDPVYTKGTEAVTYTFKDITNNVNLQNTGTCTGVIIGSGPDFDTKTTLRFENCVNNGKITGTQSVGFLYGNAYYINTVARTESDIIVANCKNNAVISSVTESATVAFAPKLDDVNEKYQEQAGGSFLATNYFTGKTVSLNQSGTTYTINTDDSAVSYKLAISVHATYWTKSGKAWTDSEVALIGNGDAYKSAWDISNGKKYFTELNIDASATGSLTKGFKAYDKVTAKANGIEVSSYTNGYAFVVKDGVTYLVLDTTPDTYINSSVSLIVYAYDANNAILGIKTVK